jgi:hypothetical protein
MSRNTLFPLSGELLTAAPVQYRSGHPDTPDGCLSQFNSPSMKLVSSTLNSSAAVLLAALVVIGTGCSKQERADSSAKAKDVMAETGAKAKELYADSTAAMSKAWDKVRSTSFDKRDEFAATGKALAAQMEAQASKLKADYSDAKASASRKAAMAELKNAEADYKQKLSALGSASSATWGSARDNTIAAWDRLEAAYYKARAD